jgi:molybdenum cofactor sulfurtransferase
MRPLVVAVAVLLLVATFGAVSLAAMAQAAAERPTVESQQQQQQQQQPRTTNTSIERLRAEEFPQLDNERHGVYLDWMGAGQYQRSQLLAHMGELSTTLLGNAHSPSACSRRTEALVDAVRGRVLAFFGTDAATYTVVFTSGATGGLKLVGEVFPFGRGSMLALLDRNHNSVLGMREYALERGGGFATLTEDRITSERIREVGDERCEGVREDEEDSPMSLFVFPGEDNFDGTKFPVARWTRAVHTASVPTCRWKVLVDAAALAPTNPLDLGEIIRANGFSAAPDFVVVSFYKMFGFPTGLGALLVRDDAIPVLRQPYWGGGQVRVALPQVRFQQMSRLAHERLEAGTISFLSIIAVSHGLDALARVGGPRAIQQHTWGLVRFLASGLASLRHSNGRIVCEVYGRHNLDDPSQQGAVVAFNVLTSAGAYRGFDDVLNAATAGGFHLRSGCMCNPGSCYAALGLTPGEVVAFATEHERADCFNDVRVRGKPVGALRASLGYATTFHEVSSFLRFVNTSFVQ